MKPAPSAKQGVHEVNAFTSAYRDEVNGFLTSLQALLRAMEMQKNSIMSDLRNDAKVGNRGEKHAVAAGANRDVREDSHARRGERLARVPRAAADEIRPLFVTYVVSVS